MAYYNGLSIGATTTITGSGVYVRKGAGTNYDAIYSSSQGDSVTIRDKNTPGSITWYKIKNNTKSSKPEGWIRGDFLAGSDTSSGSTGSGHNSRVTLGDIHDGTGYWTIDVSTAHNQIKLLQSWLNMLQYHEGGRLAEDGKYGSATANGVRFLQMDVVPGWEQRISVDGDFGYSSLRKLEHIILDHLDPNDPHCGGRA